MSTNSAKKVMMRISGLKLITLLAERFGELQITQGLINHIDLSSNKRREGIYGVRVNDLKGEQLFFWYDEENIIVMAETEKELLDIGRAGLRRWKEEENRRHNN